MGNQYHDAEGKFCSKDGMKAAIGELFLKGDTDSAILLSQQFKAVENAKEKEAFLQDSGLASAPVKESKRVRNDVPRLNQDGLVEKIVFPATHTYDAPTYETVGEGYDEGKRGSEFDGWKSVSEIAPKVREKLKEATDKGYLPQGLTYRVTTDKFAGGQAIRLVAVGLSDSSMSTEGKTDDYGNRLPEGLTPEAKKLRDRLNGIANAYNYSISQPQIDYFSNTYYAQVELETEYSRGYRLRTAKENKDKRGTKAFEAEWKNGTFMNTIREKARWRTDSATGLQFAEIEGTSLYAFKDIDGDGRSDTTLYDYSKFPWLAADVNKGSWLVDQVLKSEAGDRSAKNNLRKSKKFVY